MAFRALSRANTAEHAINGLHATHASRSLKKRTHFTHGPTPRLRCSPPVGGRFLRRFGAPCRYNPRRVLVFRWSGFLSKISHSVSYPGPTATTRATAWAYTRRAPRRARSHIQSASAQSTDERDGRSAPLPGAPGPGPHSDGIEIRGRVRGEISFFVGIQRLRSRSLFA